MNTLTLSLKNSASMEDINQFLEGLKDEKILFNGKEFSHSGTGYTVKFNDVKDKIIKICKKELNESKEKVLTAEAISAALYKFEMISSKTDKDLKELARSCERIVRQDSKAMHNVINNYNELVSTINNEYKFSAEVGDKSLVEKIQKAAFLNRFLGLKLESAQLEGKSAFPLWGQSEIISFPPPASLHPKDCQSLGSFSGLMHELATKQSLLIKEDEIGVVGRKAIPFNEFKRQIFKLYKEEFSEEAYSKIDAHVQVSSILFILFKLFPTHRNDPDLQKVYQQSVAEVRKDAAKMKQIKELYNDFAKEFNEHATALLKNPRYWRYASPNGAIQLEFLNEFIQFPLEPYDFEGKTMLPLIYDLNRKEELKAAQEDYNYFAMVLQRETERRKDWKRLNDLNHQLDPSNLTALFLDKEKIQSLQKEKGDLTLKLTDKPLEDVVFNRLKSNSLRLAKSLSIRLTQEQIEGKAPLPLYGRDLDLQLSFKPDPAMQFPLIVKAYNLDVSWMNSYRKVKELDEKKMLHLQKMQKASMIEAFSWYDEWVAEKERLETEENELKNKIEEVFAFGLDWFRNSDGIAEWKLADLLVFHAKRHLVELTPNQISGEELLPYCNIEDFPLPDAKVIRQEILKYEPQELLQWIKHWPPHWLAEANEAVPELKELLSEVKKSI